MYAVSSAISVTLSMAMFSAILLIPMLPGALIMGIMMPITGKIFDKYGPKILGYVGLTIVVVTTFLFSQLTDSTG